MERECLRKRNSLEKLLAYLQSLTEKPELESQLEATIAPASQWSSDPLIRSMWEKYQVDKESLEEHICQKETSSHEKPAAYLDSLDLEIED